MYVGFQHSHTFYVSSSLGNDTNIGSRDKPLATITEGLSRIQDGDKVMFRLYESDVHDWKKSLSSHDDIQLTIEPYGPTTEAVFAENITNSAAWLRSKEPENTMNRFTMRLYYFNFYTLNITKFSKTR